MYIIENRRYDVGRSSQNQAMGKRKVNGYRATTPETLKVAKGQTAGGMSCMRCKKGKGMQTNLNGPWVVPRVSKRAGQTLVLQAMPCHKHLMLTVKRPRNC